ncbi:MAG: hypothetical protein IT184_06400 [Acidobacteria bacterium]|nr:hypothetical protein [Acidobacteriota bacterium]
MPARLTRRAWLAMSALAAMAWAAWPYVQAGASLLDLAGHTDGIRRLLPAGQFEISIEDLTIPTRAGRITARLYRPAPPTARTLVVFPGVHGGGVDEPRLTRFSRRLAATGLNVVSVPLPELRAFRITSRSTDVIEDATLWVAGQPGLAPRARVGLVGVSFAGGLALVAAGRPDVAAKLDLVLSLGGHGDIGRVLRYLCTGVLPDGRRLAPHDYGVAVLTLAAAPHLVPADQAPVLERALLTYLDASLDEDPEQPRGRPLFEQVARSAETMPEPSRTLVRALVAHDVATLGRAILPFVDALAADPALSPERSPATTVPVFLIHGDEDNLIPSSETASLARDLETRGHVRVEMLLTPVLSHLEPNHMARIGDAWRLVSMWRAMSRRME